MSVTGYIILGVVGAFMGLIVVNYYRMKNTPDVMASDKISNLNKGNFKLSISKGIVLVDFWAPWCQPCKIMNPILNEVANASDDYKVAKVNVDNQQAIANKFKIRNIPTIIIFKNGKEAKRIMGVKNKKALIKELESLV